MLTGYQFADRTCTAVDALLDAVSCALARVANVRATMRGAPRMADLTAWVTAAESALSWSAGTFAGACARHRSSASDALLEGDGIADAIRALSLPWEGTATELLAAMRPHADTEHRTWPRTPRALSGRLRRLAPDLRRSGIDIRAPEGRGHRRMISMARSGATDSADSAAGAHPLSGPRDLEGLGSRDRRHDSAQPRGDSAEPPELNAEPVSRDTAGQAPGALSALSDVPDVTIAGDASRADRVRDVVVRIEERFPGALVRRVLSPKAPDDHA